MRQNVYSSAVFKGGRPLCSCTLSWTGSSAINHCRHQETRDTGLPTGEDHIPLHSLVLTQYPVLECDGKRHDKYSVHSIYSACKADFVVRCNKTRTVLGSVQLGSIRWI